MTQLTRASYKRRYRVWLFASTSRLTLSFMEAVNIVYKD